MMNTALWIALGAAALVILAHVALFWFFLGRTDKRTRNAPGDSPEARSRKPPKV